MENKNLNFEEKIKELKTIVSKVENDEINLDESITYYEKGQALIAELKEELKKATEKVEKIVDINKK